MRIEHATVLEMALVEQGPGGKPIFRHSAAPFTQAKRIELALEGGRFALFSNYQNDSVFPIAMEILAESSIEPDWPETTQDGEPSIYRLAPGSNFPLGLITSARAVLNADGDIVEVIIAVENSPLLLYAGEVIEDWEDTFAICSLSGSILLFLKPELRSATKFDRTISWR